MAPTKRRTRHRPYAKITEEVEKPGKGKEKGAQSQNGKNVRSINDEGVEGNGKNGRDGVHGEHYIHRLDSQQHNEKGCDKK